MIRERAPPKPFYSAGILPYSVDSGGNVVFLLGQDVNGDWSDFGGRSELRDNGSCQQTASREFYEETLGSVKSMEDMKRNITAHKNRDEVHLVTSKTLGGATYYMFLVKIQYIDYKRFFWKTYQYLKSCNHRYIEKRDIRWISKDTLLSCILEPETRDSLINLRPIFRQTCKHHYKEINAHTSA